MCVESNGNPNRAQRGECIGRLTKGERREGEGEREREREEKERERERERERDGLKTERAPQKPNQEAAAARFAIMNRGRLLSRSGEMRETRYACRVLVIRREDPRTRRESTSTYLLY